MRTAPSTTARPWRAAQRTVVTTIVLAAALLLYQSTVIQPGAVAAVEEATSSPSADPATSPTPTPAPSADPSPAAEATVTPEPEPTPPSAEPTPSASPEPTPPAPVSASISVNHFTFARLAGPADEPTYLAQDTALTDVSRFEVVRLRFEVANASADSYTWTPLIQVAQNGGEFADLPEGAGAALPFRAAAEWVPDSRGGTEIGPALVTQPATADAPALVRSSGLNPLPVQTTPGSSVLSIEFSVAPTAGAAYDATYVFRLTDAGTPLAAPSGDALLTMAGMPPLELSPGQHSGVPSDADSPKDGDGPTVTRYDLAPSSTSVHTPSYDLAGDTCAACHRAHTSVGSMLNVAPTQLTLCSSCHNGSGASDIAAAYASPVPTNDPNTRAYYQHDPAQVSGTPGARRNDCADCHNPHDATATPAAAGPSGWSASGRIYGASGAAVTNGPGGPTYALVNRVTLEYQLCFKCHSGYATLISNDSLRPSRDALDKAVEFDPANLSYHPIEAAGKNATTAMANSLLGTSPYKLWNFTPTSTIRCVNCHSDARIASAALPPPTDPPVAPNLLASASLPVHASPERGILIAAYQDRVLNSPGDAYQAADFALCYTCHAEAPFRDITGNERPDTNFRYHGLHVSDDSLLNHGSAGTTIDTPGDGGGLATCAECHFRIHSSAYPVYGQPAGSRLVDFAPNVSGGATTTTWQPKTDTQLGTCALTCHGWSHNSSISYY